MKKKIKKQGIKSSFKPVSANLNNAKETNSIEIIASIEAHPN